MKLNDKLDIPVFVGMMRLLICKTLCIKGLGLGNYVPILELINYYISD